MTPKEKAEELIMKMSFETHAYNAKHCALIAVDEILNVLPQQEYLEDIGKYIENRERIYWKEVKQEIDKL